MHEADPRALHSCCRSSGWGRLKSMEVNSHTAFALPSAFPILPPDPLHLPEPNPLTPDTNPTPPGVILAIGTYHVKIPKSPSP